MVLCPVGPEIDIIAPLIILIYCAYLFSWGISIETAGFCSSLFLAMARYRYHERGLAIQRHANMDAAFLSACIPGSLPFEIRILAPRCCLSGIDGLPSLRQYSTHQFCPALNQLHGIPLKVLFCQIAREKLVAGVCPSFKMGTLQRSRFLWQLYIPMMLEARNTLVSESNMVIVKETSYLLLKEDRT